MQQLKQAAVLGAGVMGAGIAAHLANGGMKVLLLDIVPKEPDPSEVAQGLTLADRVVRNRLADAGVATAVRTQAFFSDGARQLVTTGNFEDDIARLRDCDWVIEAVIENMEIKKRLFAEKVIPHLKRTAILTTNTSGLSVNEMARELPQEVRKNFLATHFFNPPRFMRLLELVPAQDTDLEVFDGLATFCRRRLGKVIVRGKDTPNFIANRIGVFSMCNALYHMEKMALSVEEVDAVSGPATARPSSALCRLFDLVGIDTMMLVAKNSYQLLESDESREMFRLPGFVERMVKDGLCGRKTKQGFYRRETDGTYSCYDFRLGSFRPMQKPRIAAIAAADNCATPGEKLKAVLAGDEPAARFAWYNLRDTLLYTVRRIPEITDDIVAVDEAMRWGYSWQLGPFEILDALGVKYFVERVIADGMAVPEALTRVEHFYKGDGPTGEVWNLPAGRFVTLPEKEDSLDLKMLRRCGSVIETNSAASLHDLGDGVLCLEFHSKMNTIDWGTLEMLGRVIARGEREGTGLVIGNQGRAFSAGANLALIAESIESGRFSAIEALVKAFQDAVMALKYAAIPVVAAPFGLTLGGGCEIVMHADCITASAETTMGLVEAGVGLIPSGGGTKETALRAMETASLFDTASLPFFEKFLAMIVKAKASSSADELFAMGYLRRGDTVVMAGDSLIGEAKRRVLALAGSYRPQHPPQTLAAAGRSVAEELLDRLRRRTDIGALSEYDLNIAGELVSVMTGGDVVAGTKITEQHLLDLEREAFLRLCGNGKTMERIRHMLQTGKVLKN